MRSTDRAWDRAHRDPDRVRELTGKCPPGFRWDGSQCVPVSLIDEKPSAPGNSSLTENEKALLHRLIALLVAKTRRRERLSDVNQRALEHLWEQDPGLSLRMYEALVRKYESCEERGLVQLDENGKPACAPES